MRTKKVNSRTLVEPLKQEQRRVLQLVEEGKISPEQGAELLDALDVTAGAAAAAGTTRSATPAHGHLAHRPVVQPWDLKRSSSPATLWETLAGRVTGGTVSGGVAPLLGGSGAGVRAVRVRVLDKAGESRVNVELPLDLIAVALRVGSRWVPQLRLLNPEFVLAAVRTRSSGALFVVEDGPTGHRVELSLED